MISAWIAAAALAAEPGYVELDGSAGGSYASAVESQPAGALGLIAHPSPAWGVQVRVAGYAAVGPLAEASPSYDRYQVDDQQQLTRLQGTLGTALIWAPRRTRIDPYALLGGELVMQQNVYAQEPSTAAFEMVAPPRHRVTASPVAGLACTSGCPTRWRSRERSAAGS